MPVELPPPVPESRTWIMGRAPLPSEKYIGAEGKTLSLAALRGRPLLVNLWGWPDKYSIDIDDIQSSGVMHMTHDGKILSFFEAIVRYEDL